MLLLSLSSCTAEKVAYDDSVFKDQLTYVRADYPGYLTHFYCEALQGEKCLSLRKDLYDLRVDSVRAQFNFNSLACRVGVKRFRVCSDKPGFCRRWQEGFIFKEWHEEYLDAVKDHALLVSARTVCGDEEKYPAEFQ